MTKVFFFFIFIFCSLSASAKTIRTNGIVMFRAPDWVSERGVRKIVERIENFLEWPLRRVVVRWYRDEKSFASAHGLEGAQIRGFSKKGSSLIGLGPLVTKRNFHEVLGHEIAHMIVHQKFKNEIPKWLEEGLANFATGRREFRAKKILKEPIPSLEQMGHPFQATSNQIKQHYRVSNALMIFLSRKCDMQDLLQLTLGKKLLERIQKTCGIRDVEADFKKWLKIQAALE